MIFGIGIDVAATRRIKAAIERHPRVRERLFTAAEIKACERKADPFSSFAARFAAKEAFAKAAGAGLIKGLRWTDVEVANLESGRPLLAARGAAADFLKSIGDGVAHLSLTHDGGIAAAVCVIEVPPTDPAARNQPNPATAGKVTGDL
ncbi:MAG: holo-ACP synthase [Acidobacteria bacterium]|jgi:holo-[acyl-carrier protein] synthase|nr:holo-ACP synthase [Acidobacteriota bacterium]